MICQLFTVAESASSPLQWSLYILERKKKRKTSLKKKETYWNWHVWSDLFSFTWHEKQQTRQPLITGVKGTPRSLLCTSACSISSASSPPQSVLFAMVCFRAVFHYPASVRAVLQDWSHLNMARHHLLLNGPLWTKCQTGKLLKKKCSHLLSWHFPQRLIP